jgi:hypothetical protein
MDFMLIWIGCGAIAGILYLYYDARIVLDIYYVIFHVLIFGLAVVLGPIGLLIKLIEIRDEYVGQHD